ncbi:DUF3365 domain-containing protein [Hymenobacter aerilatus]|uniref:DUF3365 domain-containing protein n=1 Tax=Hymenobacter aerilatus TaxID=2932251 RepID=A0A8T9SRI2_9BACT|nr:DUF3365 domain-containing protein [Hymenobacter aerilatus]UOR04712.1 DUF3365 domain-containing protein [Hymenobacter aerilatus]
MRLRMWGGVGMLLLSACRPDQVEHLSNTKELAVEAENHQVKRILPADLLRATRWAGDSLTRTADRALRQQVAALLQAGPVAQALPAGHGAAFAATDSVARVLQGTLSHTRRTPGTSPSQAADTSRTVKRTSGEVLTYERALLVTDAACLRCHGTETDVAPTDLALIRQRYPRVPLGYRVGEAMGTWSAQFTRQGIAEFYTMKTRKIFKRRF